MPSWAEKERSIRELERNGEVRPGDLIEAARDPNHPCHGDFTWDLAKAAQERWWDQARSLIRRVHFEVEVHDVGQKVAMYVSDPLADEPLFTSVPKLRAKGKTLMMFSLEISQLLGVVARVQGLALAKQSILGKEAYGVLSRVQGLLQALQSDLGEE